MAIGIKDGDRIKLVRMDNDPDPVQPGTTGTVLDASEVKLGRESWTQVSVKWDNGRCLSCVCPPDIIEKI